MNKKEIMKKAVELAKKMQGDWVARMALALKTVWAEVKKNMENSLEVFVSKIKDAARQEHGVVLFANVWEKYGKRRIYCESYGVKLGYFEFDEVGRFVKAWIERGTGKEVKAMKTIKFCFEKGIVL